MFYEELKKRRESLNITLEQVSNKTKINIEILKSFEAGDFSVLPYTYVRLFLKTYAEELRLNPDEILKALENYIHPKKEVPEEERNRNNFLKSPTKNESRPVKKNRNIAAITVIIVVVIFLISILKQVLMEQEVAPTPTTVPQLQELQEPVKEDTTENAPTQPAENPIAPETSSLLELRLVTRDSCWTRIITDEKDTVEAIFPPNSIRRWNARDKFDVRLGRPSTVSLFLNNRDLGPLGNNDIPIRLIVTEEGIVRSILLRR